MIHHRLRGLQKTNPNIYATINPNDKFSTITLSNNDLTVSALHTNTWRSARATISKASGKWYFEVNSGVSENHRFVGFATANFDLSTYLGSATEGSSVGWLMYSTGNYSTSVYLDGFSSITEHQPNPSTNTWFRIAVDIDSGKIWISQADGSFYNSGDPSSGTYPTWTFSGLTIYPACSIYNNGTTLTFNFGASNFVYSVPSGFNSGWYE